MLIIENSGSGKTNVLFNLIKEQDSDNVTDKIYLYVKDLNNPKHQFLIQKREEVGMYLNDRKVFIEYSNTMDVCNSINDYNTIRNRKILILFHYMIADIMTNEKFPAIIKELFIRCRKINISSSYLLNNLIFLFQKKFD